MTSGTVKFYNDTKGFGFIEPSDAEKTYLFMLLRSSAMA